MKKLRFAAIVILAAFLLNVLLDNGEPDWMERRLLPVGAAALLALLALWGQSRRGAALAQRISAVLLVACVLNVTVEVGQQIRRDQARSASPGQSGFVGSVFPCDTWKVPNTADYEAIAKDRLSENPNPYLQTLDEEHERCDPAGYAEYERKVREAEARLRVQTLIPE